MATCLALCWGTCHNPLISSFQISHKKSFISFPDQRQGCGAAASLGRGQLDQISGSSHPEDPRARASAGMAGRTTALAHRFCAEAQALFRAEFIQKEPNRKLGSSDSL